MLIISAICLHNLFGFSQIQDSSLNKIFNHLEKNQFVFYNILSKSIYREINQANLGTKNFIALYSFRLKITNNLTIDSFQVNHGTPSNIATFIKKSIAIALDSAKKNKIDIKPLKNNFILVPLLILYKPNEMELLSEAIPEDRLLNIFYFDDLYDNGIRISRFWNIPFQCYVFQPITYMHPFRSESWSKFEKYYKVKE